MALTATPTIAPVPRDGELDEVIEPFEDGGADGEEDGELYRKSKI